MAVGVAAVAVVEATEAVLAPVAQAVTLPRCWMVDVRLSSPRLSVAVPVPSGTAVLVADFLAPLKGLSVWMATAQGATVVPEATAPPAMPATRKLAAVLAV